MPADEILEDDYGRYHQCVSVSGLLVDALLQCNDEEALLGTASLAVQRLGVEQSKLSQILEQLNEDLHEASSLFSTDLHGYQLEQSLLDQAKETLIMRNLKIIQQTDNLQRTTEELEARTRDLEEMNRRDGLTDLYNREYLDKVLEKEFKMAKAYDWPLAVMFVDLDHFKSINDNYGHQAGDKVLRNTAEVLVSATRNDDLVARYGGEEFVVVLPSTSERDTLVVTERLIKAFRNYTHRVNIDDETVVTASIGVAVMSSKRQFASTRDLVAAADKAVYAAKHQGRNCFVIYDDHPGIQENRLSKEASAG
jgi:diguanylate cyclase (GGDEF)-like protein